MRALSSWEFLEHERQSCRQEHDTLTAHRQRLVQPTGAVHERARESVGGDDALTDLVTDKHLIAREVHQAVERSEEHTSELQSPCNIVCRLLLEKKKLRVTALYRVGPS